MKTLFFLFGILTTPLFLSANYSLSDGHYYNHHVEKQVRVDCDSRSIEVKGLVNYRWVRFRNTAPGSFKDRRGNTIRIVGRNAFEFIPRRGARIVFHKEGTRNRRPPQAHSRDSRGPDNYNGRPDRDYAGFANLEGVWASSQFDTEVIVEVTSEGLRAKFLGSNRSWTYYVNDLYDKDEYIDDRGNRYVRRSNRELVWYPNRGGSPIVLSRLR